MMTYCHNRHNKNRTAPFQCNLVTLSLKSYIPGWAEDGGEKEGNMGTPPGLVGDGHLMNMGLVSRYFYCKSSAKIDEC